MNDTIEVSEHKNRWWLWDTTQAMNLSMGAKSKDDAFLEALEYYQTRLTNVECELKHLKIKVNAFINAVRPEDDEY